MSDVNKESIPCDLCGGSWLTFRLSIRDYRFGKREHFNVVSCDKCKLLFLNPRPSQERMNRLYEDEYTPGDNLTLIRVSGEGMIRRSVKPLWHDLTGEYYEEIYSVAKGRVLDIGCGSGVLLENLKARGCEAYGVETNSKAVSACLEKELNVYCGDLEGAAFPDRFFDVVIMSQVIEHVPSPVKTLMGVYRILKQGGIVLVFCPNAGSYVASIFGKYWHGWHVPFHFYFLTGESMIRIARKAGFSVKCISTVTPVNFFLVSLKSYFYGEQEMKIRPIDRGKVLDLVMIRAMMSIPLRMLDLIFKGKGDCIKVTLTKETL